ncbi:hypothetical protein [Dyadobacter bucti]|uniref:hypothetical protein n=1 Tax=Dyadobacter bucti TaxID=2572203 RepID=UPI001109BD15|nr:hypothetical protein [Dyadobacter bucti]
MKTISSLLTATLPAAPASPGTQMYFNSRNRNVTRQRPAICVVTPSFTLHTQKNIQFPYSVKK